MVRQVLTEMGADSLQQDHHAAGEGHLSLARIAARGALDTATDEVTTHGFRSMASTLLNEQGWSRDAIERQLAHGERDEVRAAYNYAQYLPERRKMIQAWSDYLDTLRQLASASSGKVAA